MPLRCITTAGVQIHSFLLDAPQWTLLKDQNRIAKHLRMPCCSEGVVLKTSPLGTRFFAHRRRGDCTSKPESAEHLMLKSQVAMAIAAAGWEVATEVRGHCPEGKLWIADVMATRGDKKFAVEIQWSKQSDEVTYDRHIRYKVSGVRCLWLFRQNPICRKAVPAMRVAQDKDGQFVVPVDNHQVEDPLIVGIEEMVINRPILVPIHDFITRVFSGRNLWFGVFRQSHQIQMRLYGRSMRCRKCLERTTIISQMSLVDRTTHASMWVQPSEMACFHTLLWQVGPGALKRLNIGQIKRTSDTFAGIDQLTNTCIHCGRWTGKIGALRDDRNVGHLVHHQDVIVTPDVELTTQRSSKAKWHIDLDPGSYPTTRES